MREFVYTFHIRDGQRKRTVAVVAGYMEQAEEKFRREDPTANVTAVERRPLEREDSRWR